MFRDHAYLFSILPPSAAQQRFIRIVLVLMIATFVIVLPYRQTQWARTEAFIPIVDTLLFLIDLITAVLLFAQFAITHSRALLGLACGYLFTACIIVPHLLTLVQPTVGRRVLLLLQLLRLRLELLVLS